MLKATFLTEFEKKQIFKIRFIKPEKESEPEESTEEDDATTDESA